MSEAVRVLADGSVTSPRGFRAGAVAAGVKVPGTERLDLTILASDRIGAVAGLFTTNKVAAAPVVLDRRRVAGGRASAVVVNSGNANASTGARGLADAERMAVLTAEKLGVEPEQVLVASTGVIGVPLPMERLAAGIAVLEFTPDGGTRAARAIMTTDTRPKQIALDLDLHGVNARLAGMGKGAGMIHPNMATMLMFLTTDAAVEPGWLQAALARAVDDSFNLISIDGDTSTNDTVLLLANGAAGNRPIEADGPDAEVFEAALRQACLHLAKEVVRDGEGAQKLFEVRVRGARSRADARKVARAITTSPLVKTMVHGADPNWGRLACAAGYAGADLDPDRLTIAIGDVVVARDGLATEYRPDEVRAQLGGAESLFSIDLGLGDGSAVAWGCDLTEGYVVENSSYTS